MRYIPKNKQFLSFPARASITVLAKNVGNEDTWEGKVGQHTHMKCKDVIVLAADIQH